MRNSWCPTFRKISSRSQDQAYSCKCSMSFIINTEPCVGCLQDTLSVNKAHAKPQAKLAPVQRDWAPGFPLPPRKPIGFTLCSTHCMPWFREHSVSSEYIVTGTQQLSMSQEGYHVYGADVRVTLSLSSRSWKLVEREGWQDGVEERDWALGKQCLSGTFTDSDFSSLHALKFHGLHYEGEANNFCHREVSED